MLKGDIDFYPRNRCMAIDMEDGVDLGRVSHQVSELRAAQGSMDTRLEALADTLAHSNAKIDEVMGLLTRLSGEDGRPLSPKGGKAKAKGGK